MNPHDVAELVTDCYQPNTAVSRGVAWWRVPAIERVVTGWVRDPASHRGLRNMGGNAASFPMLVRSNEPLRWRSTVLGT